MSWKFFARALWLVVGLVWLVVGLDWFGSVIDRSFVTENHLDFFLFRCKVRGDEAKTCVCVCVCVLLCVCVVVMCA